ncbi:uncharacterized protein KZ484_011392 [Pholidichthys leucotaenia]
MGTLVCEEKQQSEAEPNSEQLLSHNSAGTEIQDEEGSRHVDSGSTKEEEEPKPKKRRLKTGSDSNSDDDSVTSETLCENETDAPQLHDCKEEEVLTVQQLCSQERNSSLDQEEQDAAQVKDKEQELCSSQEEEDFGLKQETDTFMVTRTDEDNDKSETEANSEQLLSHNSADTESQDQGADSFFRSQGSASMDRPETPSSLGGGGGRIGADTIVCHIARSITIQHVPAKCWQREKVQQHCRPCISNGPESCRGDADP